MPNNTTRLTVLIYQADTAARVLCWKRIRVRRAPRRSRYSVLFAREVDAGAQGFVVLDTAPTGHTLLLLDAAEVCQVRFDEAGKICCFTPRAALESA